MIYQHRKGIDHRKSTQQLLKLNLYQPQTHCLCAHWWVLFHKATTKQAFANFGKYRIQDTECKKEYRLQDIEYKLGTVHILRHTDFGFF